MPGALPDGEPVPTDGSLPDSALRRFGRGGRSGQRWGVYVHVPFCASRCGYCDFNTYTAGEASQDGYLDAVLAELKLAAGVVPGAPVDTVFFGGGTPTLLDPGDLARILDAIDATWGLAPDAEVTTEANPESVGPVSLQAPPPPVLSILDRRHTPGRALAAAGEARAAGFEHVNLDLIYGTPGETTDDFARSLRTVIDAGVDHVSAYSLIVEDGTRM